MHSMTGYGSGRSVFNGAQCGVEIQSVNRKQSEIVINLPRDWTSLEPRVRELVNARAMRGRLAINVTYAKRALAENGANGGASGAAGAASVATAPALDVELARGYYQAMLALQRELGAAGEIGIETVLRAPGVLRANAEEEPLSAEAAWPHVEAALGQALGALLEMRAREGGRLADDVRARLQFIDAQLGDIRARAPFVAQHYRQSLQDRLARAKLEAPIDEERLAKEVAVFAERCDISEELTRLESHLDQFRALLEKPEPVGRPMDFLTQEMARELNTLGAKANDLAVAQATLACKAELDKVREQVQNIE